MKLRPGMIVVILFLVITPILFFIYGVDRSPSSAPIVARVNGCVIMADEFEQGFALSAFASREDALQARREYLNVLISQKLVLLDAQKKGLDKAPDFLRSVEDFWGQSLLTVAMGQKSMELRRGVNVRDEDVRRIYENMVKDGVTTKPLNDVYPQIKWQAEKQLETQLLNGWVASLRKAATVSIDDNVLKGFK